MNIINSGDDYQIYTDSVKTYAELPGGTYTVMFSEMSGYSLQYRKNLKVSEKVYGNTFEKAHKVMRSYSIANKNFGVLLSGQKGSGKSLFLRVIASIANLEGLPVIIVNKCTPGLSEFISSIDQDCMVVFDEFEKIFKNNDDRNQQDRLLSLFDGLDGGHKLFVITCNDLCNVSQYILNRPGRFHYHFAIKAPSPEEVKEYLEDNLKPEYKDNINKISMLSVTFFMPYDYLRAIVFDLNQGYSLKETMHDLNISKEDRDRYDVKAYFSDGTEYEAFDLELDITDPDDEASRWVRRYAKDGHPTRISICFKPSKVKFNQDTKELYIDEDGLIQQDTWPDFDKQTNNLSSEDLSEKTSEWIANVKLIKIVLKKVPYISTYKYDV